MDGSAVGMGVAHYSGRNPFITFLLFSLTTQQKENIYFLCIAVHDDDGEIASFVFLLFARRVPAFRHYIIPQHQKRSPVVFFLLSLPPCFYSFLLHFYLFHPHTHSFIRLYTNEMQQHLISLRFFFNYSSFFC